MNDIEKNLLLTVADLHGVPEGAYNIRLNGKGDGRRTTDEIDIVTKTDKPGIDIIIKPGTKNKSVHIPVMLTETGLKDMVYNDFYIGEGADVLIIAGCGIHNCGDQKSQHDGIHTFHLEKNSKVKYVEKHYGEDAAEVSGENVLNPTTVVNLKEGAYLEMETVQIKGVDSTVRITNATLEKNATFIVKERLMTQGNQYAKTSFVLDINGAGSHAHVASRSVASGSSVQEFHAEMNGNAPCYARSECDAIIMDNAVVKATPTVVANNPDASLVHEAAIGKIAGEQLIKLMSLGLTEQQAEDKIISGFLK